jgi:mycofactocin precursor
MDNESTRADEATAETTDTASAEVVEELLIEEISIDGMCGVY